MATIIGDGTVGKALGEAMGLTPLGPGKSKVKDDVVIICVPTETVRGQQDLSAVSDALGRIVGADLIILRSTVLPGTTHRIQGEISTPIIFVPEFGFEKTMVEDLKHPPLYIIGTTAVSNDIGVLDLAVKTLPEGDRYEFVTARQAEYAKYFTNIWGCSQVILANTFKKWAGDDYEEAIRVAQLKDNLPKWGWKIQGPYGGKCLPKDIRAALSVNRERLWQAFEEINDEL